MGASKTKLNIIAIIQARTGSTRLPNKVFLDLAGNPLIWHVVERLKSSKYLTDIVLATTNKEEDDKLERWANLCGVKVFRGSENNVLDRFYNTAKKHKADIIVRITADDPFNDSIIMDNVIEILLTNEKIDFAYNNKPASFPEGLDIEVFRFDALERAYNNSLDLFEQEHVTQYFHRNLNLFKMVNYSHSENLSYLRWTIDTLSDYQMASIVYEKLYQPNNIFKFQEILELINQYPEISLINNNVERSTMYK